jgi:hypothetical protein
VRLTCVPLLLYTHILHTAEDQNAKSSSFCNEFPDIQSDILLDITDI